MIIIFFFWGGGGGLSLEKLLMHAISFRLSEAELSIHLLP